MSKRIPLWGMATMGVLAAVLILSIGLLVTRLHADSPTSSILPEGTDLGMVPAPAIHLVDQNGASVSLDQFRGHPVVLTFFDSVCPHQDCSLMAQYLNASAQHLSASQVRQVTWLAVSLNPWHDTPATAKTFLSGHDVTVPVHYLLGGLAQVAPVWSDYHMQSVLQPDGIVIHTTGVYVIDAHGREQVFLDEGYNPQTLSGDLAALLANPNAHLATAGSAVAATGFSQTQTNSSGTITLIATPGTYGTYSFEVDAWDARGQPVAGATVAVNLTMTQMQMAPLDVTLKPLGAQGSSSFPGLYRADGVLSMAGEWQAVVQVVQVAQGATGGGAKTIGATFRFTAKY